MTRLGPWDRKRERGDPALAARDTDPLKPGPDEPPTDAGAYPGRGRELASQTIPGGVQRGQRRIAGTATQPAPVRGEVRRAGESE